MESCSVEGAIRMYLRNGPYAMTFTSTQNISEISVQTPFIYYGALTTLVHSEERRLSQNLFHRHGGLNLRSSYVRSLILPGVTEEKIRNTLIDVAYHRTKVRIGEFTNVIYSATIPTADFDAANCRNVYCPLPLSC